MNKLFKLAKTGKVQQWQVTVEGATFSTTEGYVDGKSTTSTPTICLGTNIGRANERSPEQQAVFEAEAKWKKKLTQGYYENIDDIDQGKEIDPMLAHKWDKYKDSTSGRIALQPKLDGIRCIGTNKGLFTRTGKPILSAPHILVVVQKILSGLPDGVTLDGELYNHDLRDDFNQISSIVRKQTPSAAELKLSLEKLQYHVYDVEGTQQTFTTRQLAISAIIDNCYSKENLEKMDDLYGKWLEQGFEGQMVREADSLYQNGRSKSLLKRKEFVDEEFMIVDIEEGVGNRSGMMGRIKFGHFDSNARGSHAYWTELLENKQNYIGKMATVRYQNLTPDGIPRFPVMVAIRDYE
jgi:DNA ligase-1